MNRYTYLIVVLLAVILFGCSMDGPGDQDGDGTGDEPMPLADIQNPSDWNTVSSAEVSRVLDMETFRGNYMRTFDLEYDDALASRSIRPVLTRAPNAAAVGEKATIPVATPRDFAGGTITEYPEPGMTTSYTVSDAGFGTNVYSIVSTTTYPASDPVADTYVEEYYVRDEAPLGSWGTEDLIVDGTDTPDPVYRVRMELTFDDGSVRTEKIVKLIQPWVAGSEDGFAAFDIGGPMTFPEFAYPASDPNATFSSVVVYTQDIADAQEYWFWSGSITGGVIGVRYYTEHFSDEGEYYIGTVAAYERAIETYATLASADALSSQLNDLFLEQDHTVLAESVLRKEVAFEVTDGVIGTTAVGMNTVMRTHVVDALATGTQSEDFLLQLLNDDEVVFSNWDGAPYHIPSGSSADEILEAADPDAADVLVRTEAANPDGADFPLIITSDYGTGDLALLYQTIEAGVLSEPVDTGSDISTTDLPTTPQDESQTLLMTDVGIAGFDGDIGYEVTDPAYDAPAINPTSTGTIEAWVWVDRHTDTAGIVHKGEKIDFSDEGYTLQFWGKRGNVAFAIVEQNPYKYALAKSTMRLNTGKWYYLVGRWDASTVYLDIWYDNSSSVMQHQSYTKTNTLSTKEPYPDSGPLVIGSQFLTISDDKRADGYYGIDGEINGVVISTWFKSDGDLESFYEAQKEKISEW